MAHFEIHTIDVATAKAFYSEVLGWTFSAMPGGEAVDYQIIKGKGVGGRNKLTGGMMRRMGAATPAGGAIRGCTLTFEVGDVDAAYATALANGGAEALPPADYPGFGRVAYCEDGQGNVFGMMTPAKGDK